MSSLGQIVLPISCPQGLWTTLRTDGRTDERAYKKINNEFLSKLDQDVKNINKSENIFVPADKTTNFYKLGRDEYNKLLRDNTTAKYKRTNDSHTNRINKEAKHIAEKLQLEDRIEKLAQKPAFVTIKDHKENFPNHLQYRLINPSKS